MAALIDEYKQAIQDVLDGRAKPAPKPSELPWTEDKLASMWAAAAAELIAEANSGGGSSGGGVLVVNMTWNDEETIATLDKTWNEINSAGFNVALESEGGFDTYYTCFSIYTNPFDGTKQIDYIGNAGGTLTPITFTAATASDYPTYNAE